ncbi:MAG: hypothetical protein HZB79_05400 [Deltaproteobacteria bacterium]|nr:hypothetical protein [Deltaproteobacteria bacterium]
MYLYLARPIVISVIVIISIITFHRNHIWVDEVTFWRDVVKKSPMKARPHNEVGRAISSHNKENIGEAIGEFLFAIKLDPQTPGHYMNLGHAYIYIGAFEQAIEMENKAISMDAGWADPYYSLALAYELLGKKDEAIKNWEVFLKLSEEEDKWTENAKRHLRNLTTN